MFELLIAASALSLIIMIFRKQGRILEQKRPVDWAMAGHTAEIHKENVKEKSGEEDTKGTDADPIDFYSINKYFRQAETHFARSEFEDAEKVFIKVLSYQDDHPESLNKLGIIYIQQDDLRKAELMFNKLMASETKDPVHHCNYGRCLYSLGRKEEAIAAYEKAIEFDASKASRHTSIGTIYYEIKNYQKALEKFLQALELDPYNFEYLGIIADLSELLGDKERLYKTLKKMLDIDPYNVEIKRRFDTLNSDADLGAVHKP